MVTTQRINERDITRNGIACDRMARLRTQGHCVYTAHTALSVAPLTIFAYEWLYAIRVRHMFPPSFFSFLPPSLQPAFLLLFLHVQIRAELYVPPVYTYIYIYEFIYNDLIQSSSPALPSPPSLPPRPASRNYLPGITW